MTRTRLTVLAMAAALLPASVWIMACGDGAAEPSPSGPSGPATPATVTVTPATTVLTAVGATAQLAAEVRDQNGQAMAGATVSWGTSDLLVAGVSGSGLVRATGGGTATVTATAGSASGTAAVTVAQEASAVTVSPAADTVALADTVRLSAGAVDANGHAITDPEVAWASGDTLVAMVDQDGLVTGVSAGEVEITAASAGATGRARLTVVVPGPPAVVAVSAADRITPGDTARLVAEAFDGDGYPIRGAEFAWSSNDTSVARVDASGLVTAVALGRATVTAEAGDARGTSGILVVTVAGHRDWKALVALYEATDGPNWANSDSWLTDAPLWQWYGVSADSSGAVTRLSPTANSLRGAIPPQIGDFASLQHLNLSDNSLGAMPPEIGKLGSLQWLAIQRSNLSGPIPPELGNLANLQDLYLEDNRLSGAIPPELGDLASLQELTLQGNELSGPIPSELGNLANLQELVLNWNGLTGPLPPELGNLDNLQRLDLFANSLTGPIPSEFGNLDNLQQLSLGQNRGTTRARPGLTGPIPPELGNLDNLQSLDLYRNSLTGPIPSELGNLDNLQSLSLSQNSLTGPIPSELGNLDNLQSLTLYSNSLTGPIPSELGSLASLQSLFLAANRLTGPIPAELGNLPLRQLGLNNNSLEGSIPATFLKLTLTWFYWGSNPNLCAPNTSAFRAWLDGIETHFPGPFCAGGGED